MQKKNKFLDLVDISTIAEQVYKNDKSSTLWDVLVAVMSQNGNIKPYIIWILSDYQIIEAIAKGFEIDTVSGMLGLTREDILHTCRTWGLLPVKDTLDFDPLGVYKENMTVLDLQMTLKDITSESISQNTLENIIINVRKFLAIKKLLDEWESKHEKNLETKEG